MDENGCLEHESEFLFAQPGECPNASFLQALGDVLGSTKNARGTVFAWGDFENTVLASLLRDFEESDFAVPRSLLKDGDRAMFNLMTLFSKGLYMPGSGWSVSIKKLLLPTLQSSKRLRSMYGSPSYSGHNFSDMQWWVPSDSNQDVPCDPYSLLTGVEATRGVSHGGDAIAAYAMLQNSDLDGTSRSEIEASLKRYCELDTLAMAMMVLGIQDLMEE